MSTAEASDDTTDATDPADPRPTERTGDAGDAGDADRTGHAAAQGSRGSRPPHVPKQDRSRATRQRLLAAAVACLAERGWAGSTVAVVAERAGVSRGAAQHHFPTREDLFTAAVEYVAEERSTALRALFPEGAADRRAVVAALVDLFTGPLFRAALHLWVAASNEEQLRLRVTELEARVGRETHRIAVDLLAADESRPGVRETVQGFLDMSRGLGLANLLTDDAARRERVVAQWGEILNGVLD
ncbi:TetR/AcrR family transcriptional regulator [Streptomyces sp. NBC_01176]|uniref:TetR/AcrR family transcriptional regulator n=1 Tax=Streptomyces sp. NBC_01176 TaxID=2903760 RepID=UPI00386A33CF|nr:TetR/AcrR family transcriptional regulator [Streptomyces sp. NBC_01176]